MSFFDSEIVKKEIREIQELQREVYTSSSAFMFMTAKQRLEHIDLMQELLDKQRVFHARMKLCDDPESKEMLKKMRMTAKSLGISDEVTFDELFDNMQRIIKNMRDSIQVS